MGIAATVYPPACPRASASNMDRIDTGDDQFTRSRNVLTWRRCARRAARRRPRATGDERLCSPGRPLGGRPDVSARVRHRPPPLRSPRCRNDGVPRESGAIDAVITRRRRTHRRCRPANSSQRNGRRLRALWHRSRHARRGQRASVAPPCTYRCRCCALKPESRQVRAWWARTSTHGPTGGRGRGSWGGRRSRREAHKMFAPSCKPASTARGLPFFLRAGVLGSRACARVPRSAASTDGNERRQGKRERGSVPHGRLRASSGVRQTAPCKYERSRG